MRRPSHEPTQCAYQFTKGRPTAGGIRSLAKRRTRGCLRIHISQEEQVTASIARIMHGKDLDPGWIRVLLILDCAGKNGFRSSAILHLGSDMVYLRLPKYLRQFATF